MPRTTRRNHAEHEMGEAGRRSRQKNNRNWLDKRNVEHRMWNGMECRTENRFPSINQKLDSAPVRHACTQRTSIEHIGVGLDSVLYYTVMGWVGLEQQRTYNFGAQIIYLLLVAAGWCLSTFDVCLFVCLLAVTGALQPFTFVRWPPSALFAYS